MKKIKVLIVDDEIDIAFFLSKKLKKENYIPFVANTIADAETLLGKEFPSIVLLDNHLPDGYGIDYAATIKSNFPKIKIIMITAHDSIQDRTKATKNGVDFFVPKPFTVAEIASLLSTISVE